jgi:exodeoxyribonuclease VII large subunit
MILFNPLKMPEHQNSHKIYSLLDITQSIQRAFQKWYTGTFWIKAEMNKLNHYKYSGHCYPDLVERQEGKVVAQMRSTLWATDYNRINSRFLEVLKEPLKDGINILFLAKVTFNPVHGLSLSMFDIDPAYTLGDLEREKLETISRLKQEGFFHSNKALGLSPLPQRIAIISVETSKGLADFLKVLEKNEWGYRFFTMLFPALLQGDRSPDSIVAQLERIRRLTGHFDAVAIIRGGGGDVGLASYNNYQLARTVATFPIPVFTGIGHSTNETVTEMVAYTNAITPTELADFLIQRFHNFAAPVIEANRKLLNLTKQIIFYNRKQLSDELRYFKSVTAIHLNRNGEILSVKRQQLKQHTASCLRQVKNEFQSQETAVVKYPPLIINRSKQQLDQGNLLFQKSIAGFVKFAQKELAAIERQVSLLHPENVLKRGYSITLMNGKTLTSKASLKPGDEIETILHKGKVKSKVLSTFNKKDHE